MSLGLAHTGSDHPAPATSAPSQHGHHYFRGVVMASPGYAVKVFLTPSLQAPLPGNASQRRQCINQVHRRGRGGACTSSGFIMPKLRTIARVLRFPLAGLIVLSAVHHSPRSIGPGSGIDFYPKFGNCCCGWRGEAASATLSADQDTDLTVIALLRSRPSFQRQSNASLIDASKSACLLLAQGDRASYILATTTSAGISADDAVYFLAVAWKPTAPHIETLPSPPLPPPHRNRPRDTVPRVSFPRISPGGAARQAPDGR